MIVLEILIYWIISGVVFNIVVEGFPSPNKVMNRTQRNMLKFDIIMGPIGWIWFTIVGVKKYLNK